MGNKIEFPLNEQVYYEQAIEHFQNAQFEAAADCLEKVYVNNQSEEINYLYTLILHLGKRSADALDIANDKKDFYIGNEKHAIFYTMLLIENKLFLEAEVLIQDFISKKHSVYFPDWKGLKKEFERERERFNFDIEEQKKKTQLELREIATYSPIKQARIIDESKVLELTDLQSVAPSILTNPLISQMIQRAFLELLIKKQDTNEYNILWFNQTKQVVPNDLKLFDQIEIVKQLEKLLDDKLHKFPSLIELVKVEMMNDLLLLYPFIEETVTDMDYWVNCYIATMDFSNQLKVDTQPSTVEQEKINDWMKTFNQMAQREHLSE